MRNQKARLLYFCIHGTNSHGFCGEEVVTDWIVRSVVLICANVPKCSCGYKDRHQRGSKWGSLRNLERGNMILLPLDETARRIKISSKPPERNGWAGIAKKRLSHSGGNVANPQRKKPILDLSKKYTEGEVNCFWGKPPLLWRWLLGVVEHSRNLLEDPLHGGMQRQIRVGWAGSFQE